MAYTFVDPITGLRDTKTTTTTDEKCVKLTDIELGQLFPLLHDFPHADLYELCNKILGKDKIPGGFLPDVIGSPSNFPDYRVTLEKFCSYFKPEQLDQLKSKVAYFRNKRSIRFTKVSSSSSSSGRWIWFGKYTLGCIDSDDDVWVMIQNEPQSFGPDDYVYPQFMKSSDLQKLFPHLTLKTYYQKVDAVLKAFPVEVREEWAIVKECYKREK
jgi:hypothetical protein